MRPLTTPPVPGAASTAHGNGERSLGPVSPGQQLRTIVRKAVDQRLFLLSTRRSHLTHEVLSVPMMRLQMWLQRNPWPSAATVKAFPHATELRLVMPGTTGGKALLRQLDNLLA
jgi:hypothetical protein